MEFLNGYTILYDDIPNYKEFCEPFQIPINCKLLKYIDELYCSNRPELHQQIKELLKSKKIDSKKNEYISVTHSQRIKSGRINVGRFYPINSIITLPRWVKHTMMYNMGYGDIDMVKGHVAIAYSLAKNNGKDLKAFKTYINNFNEICDFLIKELSGDESNPLTKDNIKYLFNLIMYGGSYNTWKTEVEKGDDDYPAKPIRGYHQCITDFINDRDWIKNKIIESNEQLYQDLLVEYPEMNDLEESAKNQRSFLSYYFGTIENHLLYLTFKFLQKHKVIERKSVALEYDGLCIPLGDKITPDIIDSLNKHIKTTTKFDVKFIKKEITASNEILDGFATYVPPHTYAKVKEEFESNHLKIVSDGVFIKEVDSNTTLIYKRKNLIESYEHLSYTKDDGELRGFIGDWLKDETIRKKEKMDIIPHSLPCPDDVYNLWKPFAMENVVNYDIETGEIGMMFMLNHIHMLCNYDKEISDYLINFFAHMIQYPHQKSICPNLIGDQGIGKNMLVEMARKLLGNSKIFETTKPEKDVWGDFNGNMVNAYLVVLNELSKKQISESEGVFKGLVTDPTIIINKKGIDAIPINSIHRFLMLSNNEDPNPTKKGDRRNFIIGCNPEKKGDTEYFNQLMKYINDENSIKCLYEYLKTIPDLDGYGKNIPLTEYAKVLQESNESIIEQWGRDWVLDNISNPEISNDKLKISSSELFGHFNSWMNRNKIEYKLNNIQFGKKLSLSNFKHLIETTKSGTMYKTFTMSKMINHFKIIPSNVPLID